MGGVGVVWWVVLVWIVPVVIATSLLWWAVTENQNAIIQNQKSLMHLFKALGSDKGGDDDQDY